MTIGGYIKMFLADEFQITPRMQFYFYGCALLYVVVIFILVYPGTGSLY